MANISNAATVFGYSIASNDSTHELFGQEMAKFTSPRHRDWRSWPHGTWMLVPNQRLAARLRLGRSIRGA
jgi:hypothetical protein